MKEKKQLAIGIISLIIILGGIFYFSSPNESGERRLSVNLEGEYDELALCFAENDTRFYGAFWCPHCEAQRDVFGNSQRNLPYIECSLPNRSSTQECTDKNITSYPTWEFDNSNLRCETSLSIAAIAEFSGCGHLLDEEEFSVDNLFEDYIERSGLSREGLTALFLEEAGIEESEITVSTLVTFIERSQCRDLNVSASDSTQ